MDIYLYTEHCFGPHKSLKRVPNCSIEQACDAVGSQAYASAIERIIAQDGDKWAVIGSLCKPVSEMKQIVKPEHLVWGDKPAFIK